jgi:hypothetical protein
MFARVRFAVVDFAARKGLADANVALFVDSSPQQQSRRTGVRGETYADCHLRRHGQVLVARNYTSPGVKGELDMVDYDGPVLAPVEVKTRAVSGREQATRAAPSRAWRGSCFARGEPKPRPPAFTSWRSRSKPAGARQYASTRARSFLKPPGQRPSLRTLRP